MSLTPSSTHLADLEAVTRDYARYAESAGGWSAIAGGGLALASFAIGSGFDLGPAVRGMLIAIPLLWLLLKSLAARHYQRIGRVQPVADGAALRTQRWLLLGICAIVGVVVIGRLAQGGLPESASATAYVIGVLAIPVLAWGFLRTPLDLAVGTFLLCQAALAAGGAAYGYSSVAWLFVPAALLMIAYGVRDHQRFRALQDRIAALRRGFGPLT